MPKMISSSEAKARLAIWRWAERAVAHLSEKEQERLLEIAFAMILNGNLRGDISEAWKSLGYTMLEIPDLYL